MTTFVRRRPMVGNTISSKFRFRSYHPQKEEFLDNSCSIHDNFCSIKNLRKSVESVEKTFPIKNQLSIIKNDCNKA